MCVKIPLGIMIVVAGRALRRRCPGGSARAAQGLETSRRPGNDNGPAYPVLSPNRSILNRLVATKHNAATQTIDGPAGVSNT